MWNIKNNIPSIKQHEQYAQLGWIVWAIDFGNCLPIAIVRTMKFGDFLLVGIVWEKVLDTVF